MIPVFICEDDPKQRRNIKKIVDDYIMIEDLDMEVTATDNPYDVLEYLESRSAKNGIYFFDVNLSYDINGITLASKIREIDSQGTIVFVTIHSELIYLTFTYKLEVMDFILKDRSDEVGKRIRECIQLAHDRMRKKEKVSQQFYQVKVGGRIKMIPYEDIMFFETSLSPHMLILHLKDSQIEFRGSIKDVANDSNFFRCHKSAIVNLYNVKAIDVSSRQLEFSNGLICPVSVKAMKELKLLQNVPLSTTSA